MKRSEIRGCCVAREKPGLRCAPSGLRLLWNEATRYSIERPLGDGVETCCDLDADSRDGNIGGRSTGFAPHIISSWRRPCMESSSIYVTREKRHGRSQWH